MRCCTAGLPITHLSLSLHHCETCGGYESQVGIHRQADGDEMVTVMSTSTRWGPFDTWEDIVRWVNASLPPAGLAPS